MRLRPRRICRRKTGAEQVCISERSGGSAKPVKVIAVSSHAADVIPCGSSNLKQNHRMPPISNWTMIAVMRGRIGARNDCASAVRRAG